MFLSRSATADGDVVTPGYRQTLLGNADLKWEEQQSTNVGADLAFLDGNIGQRSHRVDKNPFVTERKAGIVFVLDHVELALTWAYRTPQFEHQRKDDGYGSILLKVKF